MTKQDNTNWDDELKNLNEASWQDQSGLSAEEARFDIVINKLEGVMNKWAATPVWAAVPTDENDFGLMEIATEPFDGGTETCLGDVAAVPMLGVISSIIKDMMSMDKDAPDLEDLQRYREDIVTAVTSLMVEGILISKSPDWNTQFNAATSGLS
jgi:hypothetical protein